MDLIIGLDFVELHELSLLYKPGNILENKLELLREVASVETIDEIQTDIVSVLSEIEVDFDKSVKKRLIDTVLEVENTDVSPVIDDYLVKVELKDESVYAYAPRRFAYTEQLQIREITDDLLDRDIIKESSLPCTIVHGLYLFVRKTALCD